MYRISTRLVFLSVALLVLVAIAGTLWVRRVAGATRTVSQKATADGVWEEIDRTTMRQVAVEAAGPISYRLLRLNRDILSSVLIRAPREMAERSIAGDTILILPLPAGGYERFRIEESPVLAPELAAELPEVRSFRGRGIEDSAMWLRFDLTPHGFHALVTSNKETFTIHPANAEGDGLYVVYSAESYRGVIEEFSCRVIEQVKAEDKVASKRQRLGETSTVSQESIGQTLRTYRIAVSTTQEYTNAPALGGGSVAGTLASINTWLNGVNLIFERDLSIRLVLVANNANAIYSAEPDPFTDGDTTTMVTQARNVFSTQIGDANYDVGHVLGTGGGGIAYLGVVCSSDQKGLGVTPVNQGGPVGNIGDLGVLLHELGHQFGANHSFNASCGGSRNPATAYESGSGLTIMSYAGMCSPDLIAGSKSLHFHSGSIAAINSYINGSQGGTCPVLTATGNAAPLVDAGPDYTIPRSTPFTMSAAAIDPDPGDAGNLTYSWEQIDAGGTAYLSPPYTDAADPGTTTRPIFRPLRPTTSPTRTFPSLTYILSSANTPPATASGMQTAENLSSIGRQLNFNCVVRDGRGGTTVDSVRLTVADNAGPFQVTQPNLAETWSAGSVQTITWDVNGTILAPVNCLQARITLSIDGGQSFPIILAANTQNDGTEEVTIPANVATPTARIKVEAVGNIFFDISDVDFAIVPSNSCPVVTGLLQSIGHAGANVTVSGVNLAGVTSVRFGGNVQASFTVTGSTQLVTTVPPGAITGPIKVSKPNCADSSSVVFTVSMLGPGVLAVDDGSFEAVYGGVIAVNRLTPSAYPATLNSVSIFFASGSGVATGAGFEVLVGTNPDGDANIDNSIFQQTEATVHSLDQFSVYAVPSVTITSGDFVVGFRYAPVSGVFPVVIDKSPPSRGRSYGSGDGVTFTLQDSYGAYFVGNSGIRANVYQGVPASSCASSISAASASFSLSAGSGTIGVVDAMGCGWTAVSNASWINITGGASGGGNGTVNYAVSANSGGRRVGTISIAGQPFIVRQGANFLDVDPNDVFYPFIGKLSAAGITAGCDPLGILYCPNQPVTREQMAAFIMRALGEFDPAQPQMQRFVDVPPQSLFYNFIDRLASLGITVGCNPPSATMYCPSQPVTRDQMAAFIIRALGVFDPPVPAMQRFADVAPQNVFYQFVDQMYLRGITVGCNPPASTLYCPADVVTRAQMAAFLVRALQL